MLEFGVHILRVRRQIESFYFTVLAHHLGTVHFGVVHRISVGRTVATNQGAVSSVGSLGWSVRRSRCLEHNFYSLLFTPRSNNVKQALGFDRTTVSTAFDGA